MLVRKIRSSSLIGCMLLTVAAIPGTAQVKVGKPALGGAIRKLPDPVSFAGIGVTLQPRLSPDGYVVILHVIPQAGVDVKAALRPGDKIARIEGAPMRNQPLNHVVELIRGGEENTPLRLVVLRAGAKKPVSVTVKRRVIRPDGTDPAPP